MLFDFFTVAVFTGFGILVLFGLLLVPFLFAPSKPTDDKEYSYECGERLLGPSWIRFNIRFFFVAIVFLIFDAEVAFMFPVVTVYKSMIESGNGLFAFFEILIFILILLFGLVYIWLKGDLGWVKDVFAGPTDRAEN